MVIILKKSSYNKIVLRKKTFLVVSSIIDFIVKSKEPFDKKIIEKHKLSFHSYFKDLIISDNDYELIFNYLSTHRLIELDEKFRFKPVEPLILERFYIVFCEDSQIKIINYGIQKLVQRIKGFENIDKNHVDLSIIAFYTTLFNYFKSFHNFPEDTIISNKNIFKELMDFEDSHFLLEEDIISMDENNCDEEYVIEFHKSGNNENYVSDIKQFFGINRYSDGEEGIWDSIDSDVDLGYLEDNDTD